MKKLLALLVLIIGTSGCLGSEGDTTNDQNPLYYTYSGTTYSIEVPQDWEVISQFTSDYPENTIVAFRNNLKDQTFIANVNIVLNTVDQDLSNGDYALEMLQFHADSLIDYKLLEQKEIEIKIGTQYMPTYMNYFEGRNSSSSSLVQFIQVYGVKDGFGFIATGSFLPTEDEFAIENCIHMVKSLELK